MKVNKEKMWISFLVQYNPFKSDFLISLLLQFLSIYLKSIDYIIDHQQTGVLVLSWLIVTQMIIAIEMGRQERKKGNLYFQEN